MKEVIKKLEKVVEELEVMKSKSVLFEKQLRESIVKADENLERLQKREQVLETKLVEVGDCENILMQKDRLYQLSLKLKEEQDALAADKKKHDAYFRQTSEDWNSKNKKLEAALEEVRLERLKLDREKDDYKKELLKEFAKKQGK